MFLRILFSFLAVTNILQPDFRKAVELYDQGLYTAARTAFESMPDNSVNDAYEVLCALRLKTADAGPLVSSYGGCYDRTAFSSEIFSLYGSNLFDDGKYDESLAFLKMVRAGDLKDTELPALYFRMGYCEFRAGNYPEAESCLAVLDSLPVTIYTAPALYSRAFMAYSDERFVQAMDLFERAGADPRFKQLCDFYFTECKFLTKDYQYVADHAEALMSDVPESRRAHLARILSESYLVLDDVQKARDFYEMSYKENLTRSDRFHAGSVLYSVQDYAGAVENYTRMEDRSDSLGQIANYQLGNAYLHIRNKVAALESFKQAAQVDFDPEIQEDAFMNYAKLAFDINQDNTGFEEYIRRYSTSRRGEQIYSYMALTALNRKDYAAAVAAYDRIDELDSGMKSNYMKANFLRGVQLYSSGAFRDAVPCFRAAAYYLPRQSRLNQTIRLWLAEAHYKTENYAEAAKVYEDLYNISAFPGMAEGDVVAYNLAYCFFNQGRYSDASRWFDKYVSSGQEFGRQDALVRRADCEFEQKNYKEAAAAYGNALAGSGDDLYPYLRQALSYGLAGDRKSKIDVLVRASGADPSTPKYDDVLYELGRSYMDAKKTGDALAVFHKLRETSRNGEFVAKSLIGLGLINRNQNNLDAALGYYKEVVSMMPGTQYAQDALLAVESIYQAKKQPEKYIEYVESNSILQSRNDEDRENLYFNAGEQSYLAGNSQQAVKSLLDFLEKYPESSRASDACFYIAESYKALGSKEKACDWYRKVWAGNAAGSFAEAAMSGYSALSFELEHFRDAYSGYSTLLDSARLEGNRSVAMTGMMRSAYRGRMFAEAICAADSVIAAKESGASLVRESEYIRAKSLLSSSRREEALEAFRRLAKQSSTAEGAEAAYILVQDMFDRGDFDSVEASVYAFSEDFGDQVYWLAKSFVVLGDCFMERGKAEQAEVTYRSVRDGYEPYGDEDDVPGLIESRIARLEQLRSK